MAFDQEKATNELQETIDKIDFAGGLIEGPSTPTPEPKESAAEPEPTPEPDVKPEPKPQDVAPVPVEPKEPAGDVEPATPEPESKETADERPAVPDSHYRALQNMKMEDDFAELYDKSPEAALKMAAKAYEMVNATSRQLGELGQRARQLRETPAPAATPQSSRREAVMKKLKEKYEDDPIIDVLGELIPDQPVTQAPRREQEAAVQRPSIEEEVAIRQQVNNFFAADEMDVYEDFYGKLSQTGTTDTLTPGQRANRIEVCDRAQNIIDGAAFAGMQLSTAEALERAHLEVTAPIAAQFVRARIAESVQKRAAGVTLKPSGSRTPDAKGGQYNKDEAIKDMGVELKKVLG